MWFNRIVGSLFSRLSGTGPFRWRQCGQCIIGLLANQMFRYENELDAGPALVGIFTTRLSTWLLKHPTGNWIEWEQSVTLARKESI